MRALSSALLPAVAVALTSLVTSSPTFAESTPQPARGESSRGQRPIAEDITIDQYLAVAPAKPEPLTPSTSEKVAEPEPELEIASIGPAMRPLRTAFEPVWPARGVITTHFGDTGPLSPRGHAGLDVAAPDGTPILAMDDGEIIRSDFGNAAYGGLVVVAHASGYETWYAHMRRL